MSRVAWFRFGRYDLILTLSYPMNSARVLVKATSKASQEYLDSYGIGIVSLTSPYTSNHLKRF